jgi:putative zinc finger/helix-turn-helix YgiT family protein
MKGNFCPNCGEYTDMKLETRKQVFNVRGEPIEIEGEVAICQKCGSEVFDEELDSLTLERAYAIYREKHRLLSPDEIRITREKYGLSQRALSRLLGWGEITIHRYENGAIQDKVHDTTLRLIADPQNMRKIFEANRSKLTSYAAARLEEKIASFLQKDKEQDFHISLQRLLSYPHSDLTSGFREYDLEKLENMILYLAKQLDGVLKTKLNKLLWYCDFLHFKETSVSITGAQYMHYQYGPVPRHYGLVTGIMESVGLLDKNEVGFNTEEGIVGEQFTALVEPNKDIFSETELKVMQFVIDTFRTHTATRVMNQSHQETAYRKSGDRDVISYEHARELSLSLPR